MKKYLTLNCLIFSLLITALNTGCSDDTATPADTGGINNTQPDAAQPDAAQPDADLPDAAQPDATQPDATQPDATQPDAAQPDAAQPDADLPDADPAPSGSVAFVEPTADMVYTNDTVAFVVEITGDAADVELVAGTETIADLSEMLSFTWSTVDLDEGSYDIQIHYTIDGEQRVHDEQRTVVVDRTAPQVVSSTPEDGAENVSVRAPISVTFDEALDPASVTNSTVQLRITDQIMASSVALSDDGLTITVTFDSSEATLPYDATLAIDGVTDLAGNSGSADISWRAPSWMAEELTGDSDNLVFFRILEAAGTEYMVASHYSINAGMAIKVFKAGNGQWTEVAVSQYFEHGIFALDAVTLNDEIQIAFTTSSAITKYMRRMTFDPADDSLFLHPDLITTGTQAGTLSAISLAMTDDEGLIASINQGVFRIVTLNSNGEIVGNLLYDTYPNVVSHSLTTHIDASGTRHIIFAHCSLEDCIRTNIRHITKPAAETAWTLETGAFALIGQVNTCNRFTSFDALMHGAVPVSIMSYRGQCPTGVPLTRGHMGIGLADVYFNAVGLAGVIPGGDFTQFYTVHMAAGDATDPVDVLYGSSMGLHLFRAEQGALTYVNSVDTGLEPTENWLTQYQVPDLFRTSHGLTTVFVVGLSTYIFRSNE